MAVPKRKTSVSKRNMRRSHGSLKKINVILDKESKKCIMENYDDVKVFHFIISIFIAIVFAMISG